MATSSIAPRACLDAPALNGTLAVALREDAPLKRTSRGAAGAVGGGALGACTRGPRLIPLGFGALSACITVALLAQVYSGDYELVPHGVLSSSAAACSRAATDALKEGGRALDAAAVAALCLAALAPHRTSLDASGALLYWQYREARTQQPVLYEWGGPPQPQDEPDDAERPPRLVAALAYLHAQFGALPWARVLEPAIQLARALVNVACGGAGAAVGGAGACGGRVAPGAGWRGGRASRALSAHRARPAAHLARRRTTEGGGGAARRAADGRRGRRRWCGHRSRRGGSLRHVHRARDGTVGAVRVGPAHGGWLAARRAARAARPRARLPAGRARLRLAVRARRRVVGGAGAGGRRPRRSGRAGCRGARAPRARPERRAAARDAAECRREPGAAACGRALLARGQPRRRARLALLALAVYCVRVCVCVVAHVTRIHM